ncbi:MAG: adenylate/guanylate cyclase domain-containing protein [Actinomycetota bacterium]
MAGFVKRNLADPDDQTVFDHGEERVVTLHQMSFGRTVLEPGWHWAEHNGPISRTPSCQFPHWMLVASGRMVIKMDEGTVYELGPGDVAHVPPGHDGWVVGEEPVIIYDISGDRRWARPPPPGERLLTTLLFTDVVDSTGMAERLGDTRWKQLLSEHLRAARFQLARYRGREVNTTGDGVLATFDGPARGVRCAISIVQISAEEGIDVRAGVHTGEVEQYEDDVRGVSVHVAARIVGLAGPGEVLVSSTTKELVGGSDLAFDDRGVHELKGVTEPRQIFAALGAS